MSHPTLVGDLMQTLTIMDQIRRSSEYPVSSYYEDPDTKAHVIQIAVTGHDDANVHVTTEDGIIKVEAKLPDEARDAAKRRTYFHRKLKIDDISLRIGVAEHLDITALTATLAGGMLTLTIPLTPESLKRLEKRDVKINA